MDDFHAARPRLVVVVDNNSSSESSTPCSRAKRIKGKCHLPGIPPRVRHMDTADLLAPSSSAIAPVPPKRSMMSELVLISAIPDSVSQNVGFGNPQNSHYDTSPGVTGRDLGNAVAKNSIMASSSTWDYDGHKAFSRIKEAVRVRQEINSKRHGQAKIAAGFIGITQNDWSNWSNRGAPMAALAEIAVRLNVDLYYLLGTTDEMGYFGQLGAREMQENFSGQFGEMRSEIKSSSDRLTSLERKVGELPTVTAPW